ncbi:alpha-hydroxy-acid oxidizing protein [Marinobacter hydrocarbonoclasticus]|uniref:alpha-hydroxy acid oxidase n=1 Tax=Marinobacter nauticus TaxID=2743 RepID=UPI001A8E1F67|nr:alpha-hydroxy acid oxidase [Marinobacter nauticus]MBN8241329.1 alpha-hydroxy-acid oxidizing protein [Marinobacter nauticus]
MQYNNIWDFRDSAKKILTKEAWDYLEGGAGDEVTIKKNRTVFDKYSFRPRIPYKVFNEINTEVSILGERRRLPILVGPVSPLELFHSGGERAQVQAAMDAGTIAVCSGHSLAKIEEMGSWNGNKWFQLYSSVDAAHNYEIIDRACLAGYEALVVTVDAFHKAIRDRNLKNNFKLPTDIGFGNYPCKSYRTDGSIELLPLGWDDLTKILDHSKIPVIIKGILNPQDVRLASDLGFAGVIISNHGGRQLDKTSTTLEILAEIGDVSKDGFDIYIDGGFMRGVDILMALALGANAVLLGRAYVYGLVVAGASGISNVITLLMNELSNSMAQLGISSISELSPELLSRN